MTFFLAQRGSGDGFDEAGVDVGVGLGVAKDAEGFV
jgi:hypothetical protein